MAIKIREVAGMSGSEDNDQAEAQLVYDIKKAPSDSMAAVRAALTAFCPTTFDGLNRQKFTWQEEEENLRLRATVTYNAKIPESLLRRSFDGTGGTVRIFQSLNTARVAATGVANAPDFKGTIGVRDGDPEGVDITIPALKMIHTYKWPANVITLSYCKSLAALVGTTNSSSFDTFNAGELLFLGYSCELVDGRPTEIQYHYAASADASISLSAFGSSISKGGHDYLWIAYQEDEDATAKRKVKTPIAAYVERVYARTNFSTFGYL
ncbi:MAG: hypothetical protein U0930_20050 [Pirellulales bacterium]